MLCVLVDFGRRHKAIVFLDPSYYLERDNRCWGCDVCCMRIILPLGKSEGGHDHSWVLKFEVTGLVLLPRGLKNVLHRPV